MFPSEQEVQKHMDEICDSMDRIYKSMSQRRALLSEQMLSSDIESDMTETCRAQRETMGITDLNTCTDVESLRRYVKKLEMFGGKMWCPKCDRIKYFGAPPDMIKHDHDSSSDSDDMSNIVLPSFVAPITLGTMSSSELLDDI